MDPRTSTLATSLSRRSFVAGATTVAACAGGLTLGMTAQAHADEGTGAAGSADATGVEGSGMQALQTGIEYSYYPPVEGEIAFVADPVDDADIVSTEEFDLVVCGAGIAGMTLTHAAAERGLKVILIEKTGIFNTRGHDIGSISSRLYEEAGAEFDADAYLNDALKAANYRCSIDLWKTWIAYNGEAVDWLIDSLSGFVTPQLNMPNGPTSVYSGVTTWNDGVGFEEGLYAALEAMEAIAKENGADIRYETPACQLVQDESGRVTGVIAKDPDGNYIKLMGTMGVALCTGGYENNWDMLQKSLRPEDLCGVAWRLPNHQNTGDGHMMGRAVGGVMDPYPHAMMRDNAGSVVSHDTARMSFAFPRVNLAGQRFVNESIAVNYLANAIMHQPGGRCFYLMAGPTLAEAIGSTSYSNGTAASARLSPEELAEMAADIVIEAQTVEELAEKTGIDLENLKTTLARITEIHEMGEDPDWGADTTMMMSFETGPYYAIEEGGSNLVTVSGLRVTHNSEVTDKNGLPVPGLYAIGNCAGDMFSDTYPHELSGISHSRCVVFAYLLVKHLMGELD